MNTDHKLGRAEAVRDMSRVIYDEVDKIDKHTPKHLSLIHISEPTRPY